MKSRLKQIKDKIPITLSLPRSALAALDRIRAKRFEKGATRRAVQNGALVEEAVELLKKSEDL